MTDRRLIVVVLLGVLVTQGCETKTPLRQEAPSKGERSTIAEEVPHPRVALAAPSSPAAPGSTPGSFADLVESARPAVINIYTKVNLPPGARPDLAPSRHPFAPRERSGESLGSGFIIDASGLALTNHHVIQHASDIEVRLLDDRRFAARVIGQDPKTDLGLIQIEGATGLPHLTMGDSDALRVGEWVVAIGNPLGLTSTVTAGIVSATGRRDVPLGDEMVYQDFIQTDASINPGNSGGPLLNVEGQVIGVNTAISAQAYGIGFAIPSTMVEQVLPDLKERGAVHRSWLGIYVDDLSERLAAVLKIPKRGALVTRIVEGGPADLARIEKGDVILALDGVPIDDAAHLSWVAGHTGVGKTVDVALQRGRQPMMTRLKMGALPD